MIDWWKLVWLMLPAGIANMMPPLAAKIFPQWSQPIDMHRRIGNKRIFGDHKTIRGLAAGILVAQIVFFIIGSLGMPWYFGALLGFGALGGDAIKSFFKRRSGIESGQPWFPWDQIDWIIGMVLVAQMYKLVNFWETAVLMLVGLGLHLLFKMIGYIMKLNRTII